MGDTVLVSFYENICVAHILASINTSYGVFLVWSSEKHPSESLSSSLAFATGKVWRAFSASRRLRRVWCGGERDRQLAGQGWIWRVFRSTVWCWRDKGTLLMKMSLFKPGNVNAGLQKVWHWRHVRHCKRFIHTDVSVSKNVFGLQVNKW